MPNLPWILLYRDQAEAERECLTFRGVFDSLEAIDLALRPKFASQDQTTQAHWDQYGLILGDQVKQILSTPIKLEGPDAKNHYHWTRGDNWTSDWIAFRAELNVPLWGPVED